MTYANFLKWLLDLGPKLPEVLASIQRIVVEVQFIRGLLSVPELAMATEPSTEEMELEQKVIAKAMGGPETFGGPLQNLLEFIRNNKELIALLVSLFAKK